jgi:beta-phosphoglucomutase-like phosphatase (HAD superfamily)
MTLNSVFYSRGTQHSVSSKDWYSEVIAGGYHAVIFDCDGTLVESSEAHFQSFQAAVRAQGQDMPRDWYFARTGLDRQSLFRAFSADVSGELDVTLAIRESIKNFIDLSSSVTAISETAELVRALGLAHPMAVGTNAELEVPTASLRATDLLKYFDCIVSISDDVAAKPAPDIFLRAKERLGFSAAETVMFEDSSGGVKAALDAGLDVFKIAHS